MPTIAGNQKQKEILNRKERKGFAMYAKDICFYYKLYISH